MIMSKTLVAYATKMGSTKEIAETIGAELTAAGLDVTIRPVDAAGDVREYQTVVLGSALYMRRWRPEAVRFLRRHVEALSEHQVWLFHSGPCGEQDKNEAQVAPARVRRSASLIGAELPVTFGGRLDPGTAQGFMARWVARGPMAGDFRDWERIRAWAQDIAKDVGVRSSAV
jgi:menaquinone-dependent protoporphyrinogen oxidase